jgi:flagellar biosynthesis/type III secretory pathway protein FliH
MSPEERPLVKLECLRLLTKLKLDPARSKLIGGFIDSYLRLAAEEMKQYERAIAQWDPAEREETMELISSWEQRGIEKGLQKGRQEGRQEGLLEGRQEGLQEGRHVGKEEVVKALLEYRFNTLPAYLTERLDQLTSDQLDELAKAILSFMSLADLET